LGSDVETPGVTTNVAARAGARRGQSRVRHLAVLWVALAVLCGCSSGGSVARGTRVAVVEHDYGLVASSTSVQAGTVTFDIENHGPSTHEFMIDETSLPADGLPLQADGLAVDEHSPQLHNVASAQVRVGTSHEMSVRLTPGNYVIFCNFEGNYLGGMHLRLNVTS
jgi:uncharacterized cupredoxin-like copper-binding protein